MERYIEMGFTGEQAEAAVTRFSDDLHAGCHWLMTRESMGSIPKRLKTISNAESRTYIGSIVRFNGQKHTIDHFDESHAIIRLKSEDGTTNWEHIGDGRIDWIRVLHQKENISIPRPSWKRKIAIIKFDLNYIDDEHMREINESNAVQKIIRLGRPTNSVADWDIWKAIVSLSREHIHEPSGTRPRGMFSNDVHAFRMERLSYLHAVADVYNISPDQFNEMLFNEPSAAVLAHFPEIHHANLAKKIDQWKHPQPYMKKAVEKWRKNCLPLVLFHCEFIKDKTAYISVNFHDMTFVRPNRYEPGMHKQFQRLFFHIFIKTMPSQIFNGPMDTCFLTSILHRAKKKSQVGMEISPKFVSQLLPYQNKCVRWLYERETKNSTSAWGWTTHQLKDGFVFYTHVFGHLSLTPPNSTVFGGLLAQDVGMGKTVEALALIVSHVAKGPTLVVAPTTMLPVWIAEAKKHTPSLNVVKFHGARRTKDMNVLKAADIVLTTYKIVVNETSQHVPTIGSVKWGRIILDESHEMKAVTTATTRAICRLYSPYRWCLSATPWPKCPASFVSMLAFLGVTPFDEAPNQGPYSAAQLTIRTQCRFNPTLFHESLSEMTFWQKKRHVRLPLPPVKEQTIVCKNSWPEIYAHLLDVVGARTYADEADNTINARTRILHYTRWLRQAATHPSLNRLSDFGAPSLNQNVHTESTGIETFLQTLGTDRYDQSLRDIIHSWRNGQEKCSICMGAMDRPTLTHCHHMFCFECIQTAYQHDPQRKCPLCRKPGGTHSLEELTLEEQNEIVEEEAICYVADLQGNTVEMPKDIHDNILKSSNVMGDKFDTIFNMIQRNDEKFIIFTQFHGTWSLLCENMRKKNIKYVSIEGRMTTKQRFDAIQQFQNDPNTRVFAMTTKTASVGITLTAGSHVIFMEPCENAAIKKQAIGRAWRIGQTKNVTVTTLQTEGTIDAATNILEHMRSTQTIHTHV